MRVRSGPEQQCAGGYARANPESLEKAALGTTLRCSFRGNGAYEGRCDHKGDNHFSHLVSSKRLRVPPNAGLRTGLN
jgi:hypothetical protein